MNLSEIQSNLPPISQKLGVLVLALIGCAWIVRLVRTRTMREEHALLWFAGLGVGVLFVWVDPLLTLVTFALGIDVPASTLLLLTLFFLFLVCVWLTTAVSRYKEQMAALTITVSILRSRLTNLERNEHD